MHIIDQGKYLKLNFSKWSQSIYMAKLPMVLLGGVGWRGAKLVHFKAREAVAYRAAVIIRFNRMKGNVDAK